VEDIALESIGNFAPRQVDSGDSLPLSGRVGHGVLSRKLEEQRMRNLFCAVAGLAFLAAAGCNQGSSTAPGTGPGAPGGGSNKDRKLTVTSPGSQTVHQDKTDEMTVSISRSHFTSPVKIELRDLPQGVSVVTKEMTIPADKSSMTVTLKATPDAKPVEKAKVWVIAKPVDEKDMEEAKVDFDLQVKPKS
jgi:hypothetical protein